MSPRTLRQRALDRALNVIPVTRVLGGGQAVRATAGAAQRASKQAGGPVALAQLLATSIPAVVRLLWSVVRDGRVPLRYRAVLLGIVPYLASPIDLVPDFIPVIGAMDDVLLVAVALRWVARGVGHELLAEHWTGSDEVIDLLQRLAGVEFEETKAAPKPSREVLEAEVVPADPQRASTPAPTA